MSRLRVVQFSPHLSLGGSAKTPEIFCRYLNPDRFEVFAAGVFKTPPARPYWKAKVLASLGLARYRAKLVDWEMVNGLIPTFRKTVGDSHLLVENDWAALKNRLLALKPDILHVHYSGQTEPPTSDEDVMSSIPVTVTTNIFAQQNTSSAHRHVARMLFISNQLLKTQATWAHDDPRAHVLYYPIEKPKSNQDLRDELNIPRDAFVLGRVGRPTNSIHHSISLRAYREIKSPNTFFVAVAPGLKMLEEVRALQLPNFIALPPTTDEVYLSKFYNTIDVLAHARKDGETFGCNLAEAMIHGRPVVSHRTPIANAQEEIIGDGGFVTDYEDVHAYAHHLRQLRDDLQLRQKLGDQARKRALENFEASLITRKLEDIYEELWTQKRSSSPVSP